MVETILNVLVSAASYDLTDLATAKDELNIASSDTTNDVWLARAITQVSAAAASYCNRVFTVETVKETFYLHHHQAERHHAMHAPRGRTEPLQLSRYPVLSPPVTLRTGADTPSGMVLPFASTAGVAIGQPVAHDNVPDDTVVTGFVSNTSVTLSNAIIADIPAGDPVTFGILVRVSEPGGASFGLSYGGDFVVEADAGQLIRLDRATGSPRPWAGLITTVLCQAGYAAIPDDLVDAVLRVVTGRFAAKGRDPLLKSQEQPGIGTQNYWIGSVPGVRGAFTEEIAGMLDQYRAAVV